jgi:hypothetical protein
VGSLRFLENVMTYRDLLEKLQGLSSDELDCNVVVGLFPEDEFLFVSGLKSDVGLDQPCLVVETVV